MRYVIALTVLLTAILVPSPAHAYLLRTDATSANDTTAAKTATVDCPEGESVLGMGGRTSDADGDVVLTGITVNATLTAVTAWAHARPGYGGAWSVTAMAVCTQAASLTPERVISAVGSGIATAQCQSPKILYSGGYLLTGADGHQYVNRVVPAVDFTEVEVGAASTGSPAAPDVVAVAICALPIGLNLRAHTSTGTDASPVKTAIAVDSCGCYGDAWMFSAGAVVTGASDVLINGLGPTLNLSGARARAARIPSYGPAIRSMSASEDWELTVYGTFIGSWY